MRKLIVGMLLIGSAMAQSFVTVTASNIRSGGNLLTAGTIVFQAVGTNQNSISYQVGGGGQQVLIPTICNVSNGSITGVCSVANILLTQPQNLCFNVVVKTTTGQVVLGGRNSGYQCVQPVPNNVWCIAGVCNFDNYPPNLPSPVLTINMPLPQLGSLGGIYAGDCTAGNVVFGYNVSGQPDCVPNGTGTGGSPGSPFTSVQFNCSGSFCGNAGFEYIVGTNTLNVGSLTLSALGSNGCLTNTSGSVLSTTIPCNSAGGSANQLQYNNGVLGGISSWTTNGTTSLIGGSGSILNMSASTSLANVIFPTASTTGFVRVTTGTGALTSGEIGGDCTSATFAVTCTKTGGVAFGTFATANAATPPAIGNTTPAAGFFTTLSATGVVSGAGFTALFATPPPIGSTVANTGAFTTLSASSTVNGAGFTALFASPPPIGSTAAGTGAFTTLSATGQITSTLAIGTAPFAITSTTVVPNLNVSQLLGQTWPAPGAIGSGTPSSGAFTTLSASSTVNGAGFTSLFASPPPIGSTTAGTGAFTTLSATGQITSTLAIGTAPFSITSTTVVPNLNVSQLLGQTWAAPGTIGSGTPSSGAFTTLSASGTVSGAGITALFASPPPIGGTAAAAGAFTTISATGQITSTLTTGTSPFSITSTTVVPNLNVSQLLGQTWAVPGTIGGTTPGAGFFTTGSFTGSLTTNITGGGIQCLHVSNLGVITGTGSDCGSGGGAVSSVSNGDGSLIVSPTTGAVVASINAAHANTFTAIQTVPQINAIGISAGTTVPDLINAPTGQSVDLADFQVNGITQASIGPTGIFTGSVPLADLPAAPAFTVCGNTTNTPATIACTTSVNVSGGITAAGVTTTATGAGALGLVQGVVPVLTAGSIYPTMAPTTVTTPWAGIWPGASFNGFVSGLASTAATFTACTLSGSTVASCAVATGGLYNTNETPSCWITGSGGSGAQCHFTMSSGVISTVVIDAAGTGYASAAANASQEVILTGSNLSTVLSKSANYNVTAADFAAYTTFVIPSGTFTLTLPANTVQPTNGQYISAINYGNGAVTIARNGQNLNGGTTSLTIPASSATAPSDGMVISDGSNFFVTINAAASFTNLAGGTNSTSGNMICGTGCSLQTSGSGTILATSVPLSGVTGSSALTTGTEALTGDNYIFSGVETANLTAYITSVDANSTNNNTNVGLLAGVTGTSTGGIGMVVFDVSGTGDIMRWYSGGSMANGTYTPGTLQAHLSAAGVLTVGSCVGCGGGAPSLNTVTGSAAQATGTETAAGNNYTFAGVETANLTAPFSFTDANSTNNNTNIGLLVGVTGTSTGGIGQVVYDVSGTGDIARWYSGGSVANGTYTVGTLEAHLSAAGAFTATAGLSGTTLTSTVSTGTAPITVTSTTAVANLSVFENSIAGASAAGTITEGAATASVTRAGIATANLTAPWVFQNTNSTNNNTSITMGITAPGTSTGQTVLNINGATTSGDLLDIGTGGTWTAGVLSGQTIVDAFTPTGILKLGTPPTVTTPGTGFYIFGTEGTEPASIAASTDGFVMDSTSHCPIEWANSTNIGCSVAESGLLAANVVPVAVGATPQLAAGFTDTTGTVTSGKLACYTASNTVGNCTGTPPTNTIGVFNSSTTWVASGETSVSLDATVSVTFGDNICASSSAGFAHDNGATACSTGQGIGVVKTTAASVSSATIFVKMY